MYRRKYQIVLQIINSVHKAIIHVTLCKYKKIKFYCVIYRYVVHATVYQVGILTNKTDDELGKMQ